MPEQEKLLNLEDHINNSELSGRALKNALDFVAYMRANEMPPDPKDDNWFKYKNQNVCIIMLDFPAAGDWEIFWSDCDVYHSESDNSQADEQLSKFAQSHANPCSMEHEKCLKGRQKTIFGKEFECLCTSTMSFENPDTEELNYITELAEMRKQNIAIGKRSQ